MKKESGYPWGVSVPHSMDYVEGYVRTGKDPNWYYIFRFDIPDNMDTQSTDSYLRQELNLEQESAYSSTSMTNVGRPMFADNLEELGYSFTHYIRCLDGGFTEILYRIDGNVLLVAMVC